MNDLRGGPRGHKQPLSRTSWNPNPAILPLGRPSRHRPFDQDAGVILVGGREALTPARVAWRPAELVCCPLVRGSSGLGHEHDAALAGNEPGEPARDVANAAPTGRTVIAFFSQVHAAPTCRWRDSSSSQPATPARGLIARGRQFRFRSCVPPRSPPRENLPPRSTRQARPVPAACVRQRPSRAAA